MHGHPGETVGEEPPKGGVPTLPATRNGLLPAPSFSDHSEVGVGAWQERAPDDRLDLS